ncbi:861_t:CDS:2, partial [Gigaspora margarita]
TSYIYLTYLVLIYKKLPSDSDSNSLENELGFANEMDFTNEISYANELNLDNNNLEQQELEKEQITKSETEASTSVITTKSAKSSAMQHKLPGRKKRKTPPPDKAACGECQVIKNGKKCGHVIDTEDTEDEVIDYICLSDAFDDNPDLQDDQDDYDQIITEKEIIQKKLKINSPQVTNRAFNKVKIALLKTLDQYWKIPTDEALLATILDPHNKKMDKAIARDRLKAESLLISEYKYLRLDESETDASNNNNLKDYEENKLL